MSRWTPEPPQINAIFELGYPYPVRLVCTRFETNDQGERRLIGQRTLKVERVQEGTDG